MNDTIPAAVWYRVSSSPQDASNQVPDVERFTAHHGYDVTETYRLSESAWRDGGSAEYRAALQRLLDDAWAGKFKVVIVWALDRIVRADGAEGALRIIRQLRERGCVLLSVKESWLNAAPEIQDVLVAFAGWQAQQESARKSERVKAGLERREREDPGFRRGRQPGARDAKPRRRAGYVARYEGARMP